MRTEEVENLVHFAFTNFFCGEGEFFILAFMDTEYIFILYSFLGDIEVHSA